MIEAVLFDLDETLLDLNLDAYVRSFSLGRVDLVGRIARMPAVRVAVPYCRALVGMLGERDDDLTNAAFLDGRFEDLTGIPLDDPAIADCISFYDREVFNPSARASRAIGGRPMPGAHRCLEACLRLGVKVALATNPTFPEACTRERMAWAGIADFPFRPRHLHRERDQGQTVGALLRGGVLRDRGGTEEVPDGGQRPQERLRHGRDGAAHLLCRPQARQTGVVAREPRRAGPGAAAACRARLRNGGRRTPSVPCGEPEGNLNAQRRRMPACSPHIGLEAHRAFTTSPPDAPIIPPDLRHTGRTKTSP